MSLIIPQRKVWTRQPHTPQRVALNDELTKGLVGLYGASAQGMYQNLVVPSRKLVPSGSGASIGLSDRGRVLRLDGSSYFQDTAFSTETSVGRTMACWVRMNALPASNANIIVWTDGTSVLSIEQLSISSSGQVKAESYRGGSAGIATTTGTVTVGKWHFIAAVMPSNASRTAWLDTESATVGTSASVLGVDKWITLGAAPWASYSDTANADILLPMVWDRGLSAAEIRTVRENSWRLVDPETIQVFTNMAGGALTLAGENGSLTLTGQSATTNLAFTGSEASITLTGQTATTALSLVGSEATATLTGQSATANVSLVGTNGTLTVTGQESTFTLGGPVTLVGTTASLSLAGQDSGFVLTGQTKGGRGRAKIKKRRRLPMAEDNEELLDVIQSLEEEKFALQKLQEKKKKEVVKEATKELVKVLEVEPVVVETQEEPDAVSVLVLRVDTMSQTITQLEANIKALEKQLETNQNKMLKKVQQLEELVIVLNNQ